MLKRDTSAAMLKLMRLNVLKGTASAPTPKAIASAARPARPRRWCGGRYSTSALLTSFLAAFPTDAPEYLVLVMLDEPQRVARVEQSGDRRRQCRAHRRQDHRADRAHPWRGAEA